MTDKNVYSKLRKSKQDWIKIALDYYSPENKSLSQKEFARKNNLNYKTFNDAMNRYRRDIVKEINNQLAKSGSTVDKSDIRKPKTIADQFLDSVTTNTKFMTKRKSMRWFNSVLQKTMRGRDRKLRSINTLAQGKIYTYAYDPLTKKRLPYWDQFPLIIYLGKDFGEHTGRVYFRGINLHYLSPNERVNLMYELLSNKASTSNLMKNTRLNVSWEDFKNHPKSDRIIKNYLPSHVRSTIREIHPTDWLNIIKMPLHKFTNSDEFDSTDEELNI